MTRTPLSVRITPRIHIFLLNWRLSARKTRKRFLTLSTSTFGKGKLWTRSIPRSLSRIGSMLPWSRRSTSSYVRVVRRVVAHDVSDMGKDDKAVVVGMGRKLSPSALNLQAQRLTAWAGSPARR